MKRILFWMVLAFALGEVSYELTKGITKTGIAIAVPVFCVFFYKIKVYFKIKVKVFVWLTVMLILGFFNMMRNSMSLTIENCIYEDCHIYGMIDEIKEKESGNKTKLTISVYCTQCKRHMHNDRYKCILYVEEDIAWINGTGIGAYVEVEGRLEGFDCDNNPGAFDLKKYNETKGIYYQIKKFVSIEEMSRNEIPFERKYFKESMYGLKNELHKIKLASKEKLVNICDRENAGLYQGILLGDKENVDEKTRMLFQIGGIMHILAISSLHITLIGGMLWKCINRLGVPIYMAGSISVVLLFLYGIMTGFSIATLRAIIMMLIGLGARFVGRSYDLLTALSAALLSVLIINPCLIFDEGTIMSFSAIIGVWVGRYLIEGMLKNKKIMQMKKKKKIHFYILSACIYQISLQLIMLPVMLKNYYEIYIYSFFINLIVVPCMTVILMSGLFGMLAAYISTPLGHLIIYPGCKLLTFAKTLCRLCAQLPSARINIADISYLEIILYYIMIFIILLGFNKKYEKKLRDKYYQITGKWMQVKGIKRLKAATTTFISVILAVAIVMTHNSSKKEKIVFLNTGQGAGALIKTEDKTCIAIDGGSLSKEKLGQYTLVPAIKCMGMSNIDFWFISHFDEDHVSGLKYILDNYELLGIKIKYLVINESVKCDINSDERAKKIIDLAKRNNIEILYMSEGDYIEGKTYIIKCENQEEENQAKKNETSNIKNSNDESLCISYVSKNISVLFLGDMGTYELEKIFCKNISNRRFDVIQVPHHGSCNSLYKELYSCLKGNGTAVISCGKNNIYGHPHRDVIDFFDDYNINYIRTDEAGAVCFPE